MTYPNPNLTRDIPNDETHPQEAAINMTYPQDAINLSQTSRNHLQDLEMWRSSLAPLKLLGQGVQPSEIALLSVDLIEGFCRVGPLASPRVEAIIPNIVSLVQRASNAGIQDIVFIQDTHPEHAEEFTAYPPHCISGTLEARAVRELEALPNWDSFTHLQKNSISSLVNTPLEAWLDARPHLKVLIAVGDVTDLCLYSLAIDLKLRTIAKGLGQRVIVPENCTQTWDAPDHPGDLYHTLFLYQLKRNGVEIVSRID
jgi:nicotinamidase-related amidase